MHLEREVEKQEKDSEGKQELTHHLNHDHCNQEPYDHRDDIGTNYKEDSQR